MQCNLKNRNQIIEDYLSGTLAESEREAFDEHCFNCDVCYGELRLHEEMIETIKRDGATVFSARIIAQRRGAKDDRESFLHRIFPDHVPRPAFAFAALALFAIVSGLVFKHMKQPVGSPAPMLSAKQDSLRTTPPDIKQQPTPPVQKPTRKREKPANAERLFAANFEPLPMFEEMLSANMRSSAVAISTPHAGQKVKSGNIRFEWQGDEPGPFYVKIVSNRGREIASLKTERPGVTATQKLPPGLYYWKLETKEDLLYLGKFLIPVAEERRNSLAN